MMLFLSQHSCHYLSTNGSTLIMTTSIVLSHENNNADNTYDIWNAFNDETCFMWRAVLLMTLGMWKLEVWCSCDDTVGWGDDTIDSLSSITRSGKCHCNRISQINNVVSFQWYLITHSDDIIAIVRFRKDI